MLHHWHESTQRSNHKTPEQKELTNDQTREYANFACRYTFSSCYREQLDELSDNQIMDRWCALVKGPLLVQRYRNVDKLSAANR